MDINISQGDKVVMMPNGSQELLIVQLVTDATFNGTTTKAEIQESLDGQNWLTIQNKNGDTLEVVIDAADSSFMLKTDIAFSKTIRANVTAGDATTGMISLNNNYKG